MPDRTEDQLELHGVYSGVVVRRDDPELLGRVKAAVPGILDPTDADAAPWAWPRGGGARRWGANDVPPLGADVLVQFVNGNPEWPVYEPFCHGKPNGESEAFPEHEHPDVHVWGRGPFRLVIDTRAGQQTATFKVVKQIGAAEETVAAITFDYVGNAIQIAADSAVGVTAQAIVDVDAPVVQLLGRKVTPNGKAVN